MREIGNSNGTIALNEKRDFSVEIIFKLYKKKKKKKLLKRKIHTQVNGQKRKIHKIMKKVFTS